MTDTDDPVAVAIEGRRVQLGMSKAELSRRAHLAESTVHKAISGHLQLGSDSLRKLDVALGWPTGTLSGVLAGGDPPPDAVSAPDRLARLEKHLAGHDADLAAMSATVEQMRSELGRLTEMLRDLTDGV